MDHPKPSTPDVISINLWPRDAECAGCGTEIVDPRHAIPLCEDTVVPADSDHAGSVEAIARHGGVLHVGTSDGLFRLVNGRFEEVFGIPGPCYSLLSLTGAADPDTLLAGTHRGVYEIRDGRIHRVRNTTNAFELLRSARDPEVVLVGEAGGLGLLRQRDGRWIDGGRIEGVDDEIRILAEAGDQLWLGTFFDGVLRVRLAAGDEIRIVSIDRYGLEHGLHGLKSAKIFSLVHAAASQAQELSELAKDRAQEMHRQAMDHADRAERHALLGQPSRHREAMLEALRCERAAAYIVADAAPEPTRSVLFRSAASLAREAGEYEEAERLVAAGLSGDPPVEVREELERVGPGPFVR